MRQHIGDIKMYGFSVAFNECLQKFQCFTKKRWIFLLLSCRVQTERKDLLCVCFEDTTFRIVTVFHWFRTQTQTWSWVSCLATHHSFLGASKRLKSLCPCLAAEIIHRCASQQRLLRLALVCFLGLLILHKCSFRYDSESALVVWGFFYIYYP